MIQQRTQLEIEYARDTMPRGVFGMNACDDGGLSEFHR
ncbi:hypothetical protein ALO91_103275 [Pseudomonas syringae pv. aceris]|uniref:Uncharacterized protein n=1 Tax=Pseudomonas syringae pv. aceris TaxID=199198 RepID=A0A0L8IJM1_PSESX|nr:Unknown protein sequence [Pseudomonas syringae pv. aceris]KPW23257.1 hypothetical protein ALO91_103275 [Pseudomonas syringae pv. aceris]